MDALLLEQHLRSPLRLFPDPLMAQFGGGGPMPGQDPDGAQAALLEKARQHLQMWGRAAPYGDLLIPQMYAQRPNMAAALNLGHLWQSQWPQQFPPGFLPNAAAAAAVAAATAPPPPPPRTTPPPPGPSQTMTSPASSAGSPSPDLRAKHFSRFSPYQIPQHHHQQQQQPGPAPPHQSPSPRSPSN